jgi:hypothetical protein
VLKGRVLEAELEAHVAIMLEGHLLSPYIMQQHLEMLTSMAQDRTIIHVVPLPKGGSCMHGYFNHLGGGCHNHYPIVMHFAYHEHEKL